MTEKKEQTLHIDSAEKRESIPDFDERIRCPEHPEVDPCTSYGMAGGGIGVYSYCPACGNMLSKSCDPELE